MKTEDLAGQILATWTINDRITLELLKRIHPKGFAAVPLESRGRNVAQVFAHMHKVRLAWLNYFDPHLIKGIPRFPKGSAPTRADLRKALRASGRAVHYFLKDSLEGKRTVKFFRRNPVRWMGYLISHDSHHRGQIAIALKQNGRKLPQDVAIKALWQEWYSGKR
jgi:uncharacterized damage-inducible protein DinB